MKVTILGIDLAMNVFRLHGVDGEGRPVLRKQLRRAQLLPFMRQLTPCLVGLEACHSAHYWGRELEKLGHAVRLMNPRFIKPYLKGEKNDANDAAAICEAVSRPSMRFVPVQESGATGYPSPAPGARTTHQEPYSAGQPSARAIGREWDRGGTRNRPSSSSLAKPTGRSG